jgi:hypothetical protein
VGALGYRGKGFIFGLVCVLTFGVVVSLRRVSGYGDCELVAIGMLLPSRAGDGDCWDTGTGRGLSTVGVPGARFLDRRRSLAVVAGSAEGEGRGLSNDASDAEPGRGGSYKFGRDREPVGAAPRDWVLPYGDVCSSAGKYQL